MKDLEKETIDEEMSEESSNEETVEENSNEEIEFEEDSLEDKLNDKIKELEDKNVRLLAEYQNYKRRSLEDNQKATNLGKKEVFSELLETIDNLERALSVVDDEDKSDSFVKGVQMVHSSLIKKLDKLGLKEINCDGVCDPNLHHAVATEQNKDLDNDVIIEVLQKGYQLSDIVIRPAMVKVNQK